MKKDCPYCLEKNKYSELRPRVKKCGHFRRKSDCRLIQKFRCLSCSKYFSNATGHPSFNQNKRQFNFHIAKELSSGVSLRRIARNFGLNRKTVARKLVFLGEQAKIKLQELNELHGPSMIIEFDDMETFEHTKCKPLSITLAVEHKSRWIHGFRVSQMPAKGLLTKIAFKKYGPRKDFRRQGRHELFSEISPFVSPVALIKSDENPHYLADVKKFFPLATHERFKGQRGSIVGQGELKKIRFDPLFSLNHTCAMFRANVNRLFRKTWCTTKIPAKLTAHLYIYAVFHNLHLLKMKGGEMKWTSS